MFASPGTTVIVPYTLANTGNSNDQYSLSLGYDTASTMPFGIMAIYLDRNGNGLLDPGELQIQNTELIGPEQSISLLVAIEVRSFAVAGQYLRFSLKGVSFHDSSKSDENNWVRLTVTGDSVLAVTKSVSAALARPGDPLIYAILVRNTGNRPAFPLTTNDTDTDGNIMNLENPSGLMVKDSIPEGIHITGDPALDFPVTLPQGCIALYGYENGKWSVSGNVTAWGGVPAVRQVGMLATEPLVPGQVLKFSWRGLIDSTLSSNRIRNTAEVVWSSGNETASATTNIVFTDIKQLPSVRIGPKDNPDGSRSGSYRTPDPVQGPYTITYEGDISIAGFVSGALEHATKVVYYNSLQNKGSAPDTFNLRARWIDGQGWNARNQMTPNLMPTARALQQSSIRYFRADGVTPLLDTDGDGAADTGLLLPGAVETVRVEVLIPFGTPADDLAHDLEITASSNMDPLISDTTINRILFSQTIWAPLLKTASPDVEVQPGSKIAYVINFGNNGPLDAVNATLFDILPLQLEQPVQITDGEARGTLNGQPATIPVSAAFSPLDPAGTCGTITWIFPLIPKGFQGYVSFSATVKADTPDGTVIENKASLTAAGMTTAHSNTTSTMVMRPHRLLLEKTVDRAASEKGAVISYTLIVRNVSDTTSISSPVKMTDRLPAGFHYVLGSSVLNGLPFSDPAIQADGLLVWNDLGSLSPRGSHVLVYKVQIGPSAQPGDNVNRARASGILATGRLETSNTASASIVLYENLATNSQTILGRVCYDLNRNGIVDEGEPGLPGVRIYLENGTYTITDSQGKYHFENVPAGTHVIKLDRGSLPKGVQPLPLRQTLALGDADSILVMLQQNELYKANFAVLAAQPEAEVSDLAKTGADLAGSPEPALEDLYAALSYSREPSENSIDEYLVRVRIDRAAAGPLSNAYLVILPSLAELATLDPQGSAKLSNPLASTDDLTSLIDPLSVYADQALPEAVFPFENLLWIRLPQQRSAMDPLAYDSKGGQEKVPANAQGQTIEVHYLAWKNLTLQHFLVGLNAAGTVTIISDTRTEASSVLARERRSQLVDGYRKIQPEAADAPLESSDLQPAIVKPGILTPREGDTFWFRDKITIQTASPVNAVTILTINGQQVSQNQIGRQSLDCAGTIQRLDFIGVPLREGKNRIEFTWKAPDGTEGHDSLQVFFAGRIAKVLLETRPLVLFADGKTEPELHIKPLDREGIPMADGTFITLELDQGRFISADANPHIEGFQARIRDGEAVVSISAEQSPGTRHLTVRAGNHVASLELVFLPFLRDWLVTGYGSATLRYTINQRNVFGDVVGDPDGFSVDARAAFFAKGTIFGCYLLTAALDTGAVPDRNLLFSEADREKSYPIYGDSSIQRYDAPSADARFFRIEKDTSYFQYGDFTTGMTGTELARYGRSFTGARLHLDECLYDIDAFWTVTDQSMIRDEMRGDGTSGYYQLSHTP
ncbi:MAG: SdrD B-like domain-containing protein, partial [Spirochaetales bacterium]|nr:SdrD B-like domain-containing protein [Spirochaetales bacterium]